MRSRRAGLELYRVVQIVLAGLLAVSSARSAAAAVASDAIVNVATARYSDSNGNSLPEAVSNTVVTRAGAAGTGADGSMSSSPSVVPGQVISVTVTDQDQNADPGKRDTATLTITNQRTGESENATCIETGPNTGIFVWELPTVLSSAAGTPDDGVLGVKPGDQATTAYLDLLTSTGSATALSSTTLILSTDIIIRPNPDVIVANGTDTSLLTSRVTDERGAPLPDGTPVRFTTDKGAFENGLQATEKPVVGGNGEAAAVLTAPVLTVPAVAEIRAWFGGTASDVIRMTVLPGAASVRVFNAAKGSFVQATDEEVSVQVVVTGNADDGSPIETVVAIDTLGVFAASDLPPGNYRLRTVVTNRSTGATVVENAPQNIRVDPGGAVSPGKNTLTGAVRSRKDPNRTFAGAAIELFDASGRHVASTQTDAAGKYLFDDLEPGSYYIIATTPDQEGGRFELPPITQNAGVVVIDADPLIDPFGIAFDAATGIALPGSFVTIAYPLTGEPVPIPQLAGTGAFPNSDNLNPFVTDANGKFAFLFGGDQVGQAGSPVRYEIRAVAPSGSGFPSRTIRIDVSPISVDQGKPIIHLIATALDSLPLCEPGSLELSSGQIEIPNIETVSLNIPFFSTTPPLVFAKEAPDSAFAGDEITYSIGYRNSSVLPVEDVLVSDVLPAGTAFRASSHAGVFSNGAVTWRLGSVPAGSGDTLRITVDLDPALSLGASIYNRADLAAHNILPLYSGAYTRIKRKVVALLPDLVLRKTAQTDTADAAGNVRFWLRVQNAGNAKATNVSVVDTLSARLAAGEINGSSTLPGRTWTISRDGVMTWLVGDLEPGESDTLSIKAAVLPSADDGRRIINRAWAVASNASAAMDSVAVATRGRSDLWIAMTTDEETVAPGQVVTFTVLVGNRGTGKSGVATVVDPMLSPLRYVEDSSAPAAVYSEKTQTLSWRLDNLLPGDVDTVRFQARVPDSLAPGAHTLGNTAFLEEDGVRVGSSGPVFVSALVPYLSIEKSVSKTVVEPGDIIRYHIEVTNSSASDSIHQVSIEDRLPHSFGYVAGTTLIDRRAGREPSSDAGVISWSLGSLGPSSSLAIDYKTVVGADADRGDGMNKASATGLASRGVTGTVVRSGIAKSTVVVRTGLFAPGEVVFGKVWVDANGNRIHDDGERTLPGVVLLTEDGTRVTTDEFGNYSIPEVKAGDHVIRLMERSLPHGLHPVAPDNSFFGDGLAQFVTVPKYAAAKANFVVVEEAMPAQSALPESAPARPAAPPQVVATAAQRPAATPKVEPITLTKHASPESLVVVQGAETMTVTGALFEPGKAVLLPEAMGRLKQLSERLSEARRIDIKGHTDSRPIHTKAFPSNLELSNARARSIGDFLAKSCGIDAARIHSSGLAATQPVASNDTPEGRARNRRVEVIAELDTTRTRASVRYTLSVTCSGPDTVRSAVLIDSLPAGAHPNLGSVSVKGADATPVMDSSHNIFWRLGDLGPTDRATIALDADVEVAGLDSVVNKAYLYYGPGQSRVRIDSRAALPVVRQQRKE